MSISKYQRLSLKNHHKELDIPVFGTNIPAYWHHWLLLTVISAITAVTTLQCKIPGDFPGKAFPFMVKASKEMGGRCLNLALLVVALPGCSSDDISGHQSTASSLRGPGPRPLLIDPVLESTLGPRILGVPWS